LAKKLQSLDLLTIIGISTGLYYANYFSIFTPFLLIFMVQNLISMTGFDPHTIKDLCQPLELFLLQIGILNTILIITKKHWNNITFEISIPEYFIKVVALIVIILSKTYIFSFILNGVLPKNGYCAIYIALTILMPLFITYIVLDRSVFGFIWKPIDILLHSWYVLTHWIVSSAIIFLISFAIIFLQDPTFGFISAMLSPIPPIMSTVFVLRTQEFYKT
jgi:hypothetical protein